MSECTVIICGSAKKEQPAPAEQLYSGDLFQKRLEYARILGFPIFFLSHVYGLMKPEQVIRPYEYAPRTSTPDYKRLVSRKAAEALWQLGVTYVVVLGGWWNYGRYLRDALEELGMTVRNPLRGKIIGLQKEWLRLRIEEGRNVQAS